MALSNFGHSSHHLLMIANQAARNHQFEEAIQICRSLLKNDKQNPQALFLMGSIAFNQQDYETALKSFSSLQKIAPNDITVKEFIARTYTQSKTWDKACTAYRTLLKLSPHNPNYCAGLIKALIQTHNVVEAKDLLDNCLEQGIASPALEAAHITFLLENNALTEARRRAEALSQAHGLDSELADLCLQIYQAMDDWAAANRLAQQTLVHVPNHLSALKVKGILAYSAQNFIEAVQLFTHAHTLAPTDKDVLINLSASLLQIGQLEKALEVVLSGLRNDKTDERLWNVWAEILHQGKNLEPYPQLAQDILTYTDAGFGSFEKVKTITQKILDADKDIQRLLSDVETLPNAEVANRLIQGRYRKALGNPLLCSFIKASAMRLSFETCLTGLRKVFLLNSSDPAFVRAVQRAEHTRFLIALFQQNIYNEGLFAITEAERNELDHLQTLDLHKTQCHYRCFIACCYHDIDNPTLEQFGTIVVKDCKNQEMKQSVQNRLFEIKTLDEIKSGFSKPDEQKDRVSLAVKGQYELNPYPRWTQLPAVQPRSLTSYIHGSFPLATTDFNEFPPSNLNILVAGCGTGKQALSVAATLKDAHVRAIDLSESSLAYAEMMRRKLKIENLTFESGNILDLDEKFGSFDAIFCSGVLHHMADPEAGLKALLRVAKQNCALFICLYSTLARQRIAEIRHSLEQSHIRFSLAAVRNLRQQLSESTATQDHAFFSSTDFASVSGIRDLIWHEQETTYRLAEIDDMLCRHQLKLCGLKMDNLLARALYQQQNPGDLGNLNLQALDAFEQVHPQTFTSMYHLLCRKI